MPRPINRIPKGLLDFLGLKALGRNPEVFMDDVRPTFELSPWYLGTHAEGLAFSEQLTNVLPVLSFSFRAGFGTAARVPANEWWYLHAATLIVVAPVNAAFRRPGGCFRVNSGINTPINGLVTYPGYLFSNAAQQVGMQQDPTLGVFVPPGTDFGWACEELNLTAMGGGDIARVNLHLTITRLGS